MASLPDSIAETALARLFTGDTASREAVIFSLPGGHHLFNAGDAADHPPVDPNLRTRDALEDDPHSTVTDFARLRG